MRLKPLLFLALLVAVPVLLIAVRPDPLSPREDLARLRASIESEHPDEEHTLRRLGRLLRDARDAGDEELVVELLDVRARYLSSMGSAENAKRDLQELLDDHLPGDAEVRLRLALTEIDAGETDSAKERLLALVRDEPEFLSPRVELGVLQLGVGNQLLADAADIARPLLIETDYTRAVDLLKRLGAQDPRDRARTATIFSLRELFRPSDEVQLSRVLILADTASHEIATARQAFATSFAIGLDRRAITGFLQILVDAGEVDLAVQTGMLGLQSPALRDNTETVRLLLDVLLERGDYTGAGRVAMLSLDSDLAQETDHLHLLCYALYRAEIWGRVVAAANKLSSVGREDDTMVAKFYRGMAIASATPGQRPLRILRDFATSKTPEPFPGARAAAWFQVARIAQELEDEKTEREALTGALALEPDQHGADWLRLSELQEGARYGGYRAPLESYTRGMSQAPRFTAELMDKWVELGERVISAGGRDIAAIERGLRDRARFYPIGDVDPYLFYRLAERNLERGAVPAASTITRRLLDAYPGLLPAVDLMIRISGEQSRRVEQVEWIVHRFELAGPDETSREFMAGIEPDELTGAQLVRLMQADPAGFGRLEVAKSLTEAGDDEAALIAMDAPATRKSDAERLTQAGILFRLGRFEEALPPLLAIPPTSPEAPQALRETILASLYVGKVHRIPVLIGDLLAEETTPADTAMLAGDLYLRAERPEEAVEVLTNYEARSPAGWDVLQRIAQASLLLAEAQETAEERVEHDARAVAAIDRAEGLESSYAIAVGRLLVALSSGDLRQRDFAGREIAGYDAGSPALVRALAAAATESWIEVSGIVDEEIENAMVSTPDDAVWGLLKVMAAIKADAPAPVPPSFGKVGGECVRFWRGTDEGPRSDAETGALLLAVETPGFELYALEHLRQVDPQHGGDLWRVFLEARVLYRLDELFLAQERAERVCRDFPDFQPAWTLLEAIERERLGKDHPRLAAIRAQREAGRDPRLARAERALGEARAKLEEGKLAAASTQVEGLLEAAPEWLEARALLAEVRVAQDRDLAALEVWKDLCTLRPEVTGKDYVDDYLACLHDLRTRNDDLMSAAAAAAQLAELAELYPREPGIVLAQAEADLELDPENIAICVSRALRRLEDFRAGLGGRTLESVKRGTLASWVDFYARLDPALAERVLNEERELDPGAPTAWRLLGRLARQNGDLAESRKLLYVFSRMLPDAATQLELAETSIALGAPHGAVARHLREAQRLGARTDSLHARALAAESQLGQATSGMVASAIDSIAPLWDLRSTLDREAQVRIALLYARALLTRGDAEDDRLAKTVLTEGLRKARDPYRAATMRALLGVANLENSALVDADD